ncbi:MAG: hypothetical protein ACP5SF_05690 [Thermoplasmata archaeon]
MNIFDKYYYGENGQILGDSIKIAGEKIGEEVKASEINISGILIAKRIKCNGLYVKGSVHSDEITTKLLKCKGEIIAKNAIAEKISLIGQIESNNISAEEINIVGKLKSNDLNFKNFYLMGEIFSKMVDGDKIEVKGGGKIEEIKCKEIKIKRAEKRMFWKSNKLEIGKLTANNVDIENCIVKNLECNSGNIGDGAKINHLITTGKVQISKKAVIEERR